MVVRRKICVVVDGAEEIHYWIYRRVWNILCNKRVGFFFLLNDIVAILSQHLKIIYYAERYEELFQSIKGKEEDFPFTSSSR